MLRTPEPDVEAAVCPITLEPISRGVSLRGRVFELSSIVRLLVAARASSRPALHPLHRTPLTEDEVARVMEAAWSDPECTVLLAEGGWRRQRIPERREGARGDAGDGGGTPEGAPHAAVPEGRVGPRALTCPLGLIVTVLVVIMFSAMFRHDR